jgi:hypothetical protein
MFALKHLVGFGRELGEAGRNVMAAALAQPVGNHRQRVAMPSGQSVVYQQYFVGHFPAQFVDSLVQKIKPSLVNVTARLLQSFA